MHTVIVPRRSCLTDCVFFVKLINSFIHSFIHNVGFGNISSQQGRHSIYNRHIARLAVDMKCHIHIHRFYVIYPYL